MLRPLPGSERVRVIGLLDAFQAAERAGVEAVGRWIVACADARLRGGLRVIRARDRRHAALAEARLRSLGGVPGARPSRELAAVCGVVADPGVSDRSKLALILGRLPAREDAPLGELVRRAEGDAETHALLETIVDDVRAAEAASAEVLAAWIAVCELDGLRGGLRVIAEREAAHAELLAERLGEMGVAPSAVLAEPMRAAALERFGSERVSDEQKLAALLARYPDDTSATRPITDVLDRLHHD